MGIKILNSCRFLVADWLISKKYSQPTEPLVYILYCIICMLMFHHACLSFSIIYDHLKLACKHIFQKIETFYEKASIEVDGKHFDEILLTFDPSPEIFIFILSASGFT
jgi:hypothetical protein